MLFLILFLFAISTGMLAQAPTISSFTPNAGVVGTLVTINGTNLGTPTAVTIGGTAAVLVSSTGNKIVALVMPGAVTGSVGVTTAGGSASGAGSFNIQATGYPSAQQGNKLQVAGASASASFYFGGAIALSADGNTAVVGARQTGEYEGGAYVYVRSGNTWAPQGGKLLGTGASGKASQGQSVAISADGNTIAVGGYQDATGGKGAVWIFTRNSSTWSQQGSKLVGAVSANSNQGASVALSANGNTLIFGGPWDGYTSTYYGIGAAWIFTRSNNVWSEQAKLVGTGGTANSDQFQGASVALSADGKTALLGAPADNAGQGAAWVFVLTGGSWLQQGSKITGSGSIGTSTMGVAVALSANGSTAIVGGSGDNNNTGAAWVFTRNGSNIWSQQGSKLVGLGSADHKRQGGSVSLSADGNTAILGGSYQGTIIIGASWIFTRTGSTWHQPVQKLVGSGSEWLPVQGTAVALSADASTCMSGGPLEVRGGAVWAFVHCSSAPTVNAGNNLTAICAGNSTVALGGSFGGSATGAIWSDEGAGGSFTNNDGSTPGSTTYLPAVGKVGTIPLYLTSIGGNCASTIASKSQTVNSSSVSTWLGNTTSWSLASNWSTGAVPTACTKVIVNAGVLNMPVISGSNNTCLELQVNSGAEVHVATNAKLTVVSSQ